MMGGGYSRRVYGSFSGKTAGSNVIQKTGMMGGGYSRRAYGSFAGKTAGQVSLDLHHPVPFGATVNFAKMGSG